MSSDPESHLLVNRPERLVSLDVLRGFDMFWIIGGKTDSGCNFGFNVCKLD